MFVCRGGDLRDRVQLPRGARGPSESAGAGECGPRAPTH